MLSADHDLIVASAVDETIYDTDVYALPETAFARLRTAIISEYIQQVESSCASYRTYARRFAGAIAPIPTAVFKSSELVMKPRSEVEKWCLSSGTLGRRSQIGRDRVSLERLLASVRKGLSLFEEWDEEEMTVLHLGPAYEQAGDVWLPYVMSLTELLYPTVSFCQRDVLNVAEAVATLRTIREAGRKVGIVGPPFAIKSLCNTYESGGHPADGADDVVVVSAGGWKTHVGEAVSREEFRDTVTEVLGLTDSTRVRDSFNQVELNTVLMECAQHRFHIPPWVQASARCVRTLQALPHGQPGLISFVDASASSYPCIFVGDDLGRVSDAPCSCGRPGHLLQLERRVERGLDNGCAFALSARYLKGLANV